MKTLNSIFRINDNALKDRVITTIIIKVNPLLITEGNDFNKEAADRIINIIDSEDCFKRLTNILYVYDFNSVGDNLLETGSKEFRDALYSSVDSIHNHIVNNSERLVNTFVYYKVYGTSTRKNTRFYRPVYNFLMITKANYYNAVFVCSSADGDNTFADMGFLDLIRI